MVQLQISIAVLGIGYGIIYYLSRGKSKSVFGYSDTNRHPQSPKKAKRLKFLYVSEVKFTIRKNKDADQSALLFLHN